MCISKEIHSKPFILYVESSKNEGNFSGDHFLAVCLEIIKADQVD